jgi:hypothetical protein
VSRRKHTQILLEMYLIQKFTGVNNGHQPGPTIIVWRWCFCLRPTAKLSAEGLESTWTAKYIHTLLSRVPLAHRLQTIHSFSYNMSHWPMDCKYTLTLLCHVPLAHGQAKKHTLSCLVSHWPMECKIYSQLFRCRIRHFPDTFWP